MPRTMLFLIKLYQFIFAKYHFILIHLIQLFIKSKLIVTIQVTFLGTMLLYKIKLHKVPGIKLHGLILLVLGYSIK